MLNLPQKRKSKNLIYLQLYILYFYIEEKERKTNIAAFGLRKLPPKGGLRLELATHEKYSKE